MYLWILYLTHNLMPVFSSLFSLYLLYYLLLVSFPPTNGLTIAVTIVQVASNFAG